MARRTLALLLLLAAACAVQSYPLLWATDALPKDVLKPLGQKLDAKTCLKHPTTKEKGHGAPSVDKGIAVAVTEAGERGGEPVKSLCPGQDYTVTVVYPEPRRTFLTSSVGAFEGANEASCPGAVYTTKTEKSQLSYNKTISIPCNATAKSASMEVTSAAGPDKAFKTATATLPLAPLSECPKSSCASDAVPAPKTAAADSANTTKGDGTPAAGAAAAKSAAAGSRAGSAALAGLVAAAVAALL